MTPGVGVAKGDVAVTTRRTVGRPDGLFEVGYRRSKLVGGTFIQLLPVFSEINGVLLRRIN